MVPGNPGGSAGGSSQWFEDMARVSGHFTDFVTSKENQSLFFLGSTLVTPAGWILRGPSAGSFVLWKGRQALLLLSSLKHGKGSSLIVDGSSSQDLVQNGGPSAPLVQRGQLSDVLSLGKTLKTQSAHGFRSGEARTAGGKRRIRRYPLSMDWDDHGVKGHNPCAKGYYPKKIKGRWYCVLGKR